MYNPKNPLIVQSDKSILLEVDNACYEEARDLIARFSELVKSPEHIHTYKVSNLSLWNAAAAGMTAESILEALKRYSRYEVPSNVEADVIDYISRYGRLKLKKKNGKLILYSHDPLLITEVWYQKRIRPFLITQLDQNSLEAVPTMRGHLKQALLEIGFPAEDLAGYVKGDFLSIELLETTKQGKPFVLRYYQKHAIDVFYAQGSVYGGSGTIVLPCGAGKTMVGMGIISNLKCHTLIITPNIIACRQWKDELLDKTTLTEGEIGEYSGEKKEIKPVTLTTYQILTYRSKKQEDVFPHFALFNTGNWGLIIYEEVHLLPAPVFRITAELQARRRLGLTATLVREDGREGDVFSLIGPKRYDAPWKELESEGWIAEALCQEIRVSMDDELRFTYAISPDKNKYRIAAENPRKFSVVEKIVNYHRSRQDKILIIGMYINHLEKISQVFGAPLLTGSTSNRERRQLYDKFRGGEMDLLVVSKVANFAIDLPEANVAIQISGTFGSRQEEAQRLGRILRPKEDGSSAHFYSIVTKDTKDQDFSAKRQLFLTEQGYKYWIGDRFLPI